MMKWTASLANARRWQMVAFRGPGGQESRGVVDVIAIRKNQKDPGDKILKRGDLFDIILIQIKGGGAAKPKEADKERLLKVKKKYAARDVVLFSWKKNQERQFSILGKDNVWHGIAPEDLFV
ncbi:MAG: hypothetical protein PHU25_09880 [Deltaproteobacteria bacterium]|nr:hypothetical protein [Deltaproteobacteria bacterium]